MASEITDDAVAQFMSFAGSADPSVARQYLEMSGNDLGTAVGLFMDHQGGGGGRVGGVVGGGMAGGDGGGGGRAPPAASGSARGGGGGGESGLPSYGTSPDIRAPDATRTMRLLGDSPSGGRGRGGGGLADPPPALMAAMGGPAAREMMRNMNMMMPEEDAAMISGGGMASTWAALDAAGSSGGAGRSSRHRARSGSGSGDTRRRNQHGSNNDDEDSEDRGIQVADADRQAMDEDGDEYNYNDGGDDDDSNDDDSHDLSGAASDSSTQGGPLRHRPARPPPSLSTMFAQPTHLMHHAGGFMGARNFARDARRWLLVNIQSDDDFACHALNRDVWRDELVENLVREGFILWQAMSHSNEGQTYITRYKVQGYPHLAIIDPRTGGLLWRKENWTQVDPLTAEQFVEIASDFCSMHSFDKPPSAAKYAYANGGVATGEDGGVAGRPANGGGGGGSISNKRPIHELTEEEQLQAAIRASMEESAGDDKDAVGKGAEVVEEGVGTEGGKRRASVSDGDTAMDKKNDNSKPTPFEEEILSMEVGVEPKAGSGADVARVQIRMPDGKRLVRRFDGPVKLIYAFVAQSNEEAKGGRAFELKAKFPPQDLYASREESVKGCGLNGEAINVIWK